MTRVLIIGSSHVAAYKSAADAFAETHPDVDLEFFGLRGPLFLGGQIGDNGHFLPPYRNDKDRNLAIQTNGRAEIDATGHEHLLLVGHRFAFTHFPLLLEGHDILGGMRTDRPRLMSEEMVKETVEVVTRASVKEVTDKVKALGRPVTFAMAPYPATSIVERAPGFELARMLQEFWSRPDAAWVHDLWLTTLKNALADQGHLLLEQPEELNAGPFATRPEFASRATAMDGGTLGKTDHRHMNAYFGLAMLKAYAKDVLELAGATKSTTTRIKTIQAKAS